MSTTFVTPPHIIAAISQFQAAILPAVLDPAKAVENGTVLFAWCKDNGIAFESVTPDDLRRAASAEVAKLFWKVKPMKLTARENAKPKTLTELKAEEKNFFATDGKNQKMAEQSLADAKAFAVIEQAIKSYSPRLRFGQPDTVNQEREQKRLREFVKPSKGSYPVSYIAKWVSDEIERLYAAEAKRYERI